MLFTIDCVHCDRLQILHKIICLVLHMKKWLWKAKSVCKRKIECVIICQISSDVFNKAQSVTSVCMRSGVATRSRSRTDCIYWYEKEREKEMQESSWQKRESRFKKRGGKIGRWEGKVERHGLFSSMGILSRCYCVLRVSEDTLSIWSES